VVAQKTVVLLTDDLTGDELAAGEGQTVRFELDNTTYEIDLSKKNADKLRNTMAQYVRAARKTSGGKADGRRRKSDGPTRLYDPKIIRRWAEAHNVELPKRGRIPQRIIEQFEADEEATRNKAPAPDQLFSQS
jgi:Lsr2